MSCSTCRPILILAGLLAGSPPAAAQVVTMEPGAGGPTRSATDASPDQPMKFIPVPRATTFLEEKTLDPDPVFTARAGRRPPPSARIPDDLLERSTALKLYAFMLDPGETLKVRLTSELHGKVAVRFLRPSKVDPMDAQFRRIAMMPPPMRASGGTITNVTQAPYQVVLMACGQPGYSYRIDLERTPGK